MSYIYWYSNAMKGVGSGFSVEPSQPEYALGALLDDDFGHQHLTRNEKILFIYQPDV